MTSNCAIVIMILYDNGYFDSYAMGTLIRLLSVTATQTFKLPLGVVQFAFRKMEHERDMDEIECLLANLIYRVSTC